MNATSLSDYPYIYMIAYYHELNNWWVFFLNFSARARTNGRCGTAKRSVSVGAETIKKLFRSGGFLDIRRRQNDIDFIYDAGKEDRLCEGIIISATD